ncbi:hypothetical protein ALI22I_33770 [Saccharothrix sp. ALI-22-I]|uniref:hypothetical protein n=1 Tax=Saccharothrix sp. ALI-22-I TaxID=1933778 RepID=UPI00097BF1BA|nr:hypothetical protein [Saccharothrix sp. ALI-22-I]ONI83471.1 hypothetical protein ALI22I_33770 [Saccharothrix sp. ALI-22-I]
MSEMDFYTVIGVTSEDGEDLTVAAVTRGQVNIVDQHDRGWFFGVEADDADEARVQALAEFKGLDGS